MIARVIEFSARNPFLIVVLVATTLAGGSWAIFNTPLDAIPDLSDVQVIVYTPWEDRSPDIIEDQVTYPIVTQLLSAPRVKAVRANSFFGFSLIYVIFDDGTDLYWARSRVLEYMSGMAGKLPAGVAPQLGPDATGVGWGLEYVLIDRTGRHNLAELRTLQDWHVQYQLRAVPGVAEVAAVGALRQAVPGDDRPGQAARLRHPDQPRGRTDSDEQPGGRRPGHRVHRARVHGARAGLHPGGPRHRGGQPGGPEGRDADPGPRRGRRAARTRHPPRRGGLQRPGRRRRGRRRGSLRRERLRRAPEGQADDPRDGPAVARRGSGAGRHLRPLRPDRTLRGYPAREADRRKPHRQPGLCRVSRSLAQRARGRADLAPRRAAGPPGDAQSG